MPEMPNPSRRPFIELRLGPINELRRTSGGGGRTRYENAIQHGQLLLSQIDALQQEIERFETERPLNYPSLSSDIQVVIEGELDAETLRNRLDIQIVEEREEKKFIGISQDEELETLSDRINTYITEETVNGNPRYQSQIDPIDAIRVARREDKIGLSLQK